MIEQHMTAKMQHTNISYCLDIQAMYPQKEFNIG
jgi:hypothetical protein